MSLSIRYITTCDYCGVVIKEDSFESLPYFPAREKSLPLPEWTQGIGHFMACGSCVDLARKGLKNES
jgi:hypothetical protein